MKPRSPDRRRGLALAEVLMALALAALLAGAIATTLRDASVLARSRRVSAHLDAWHAAIDPPGSRPPAGSTSLALPGLGVAERTVTHAPWLGHRLLRSELTLPDGHRSVRLRLDPAFTTQ